MKNAPLLSLLSVNRDDDDDEETWDKSENLSPFLNIT
jgi:hypothetical protein